MMDDLFRWASRLQTMQALPLLFKVTLIVCIGRLVIAALPRATAAVRFGIAMMTLAGALVLPLVMVTPMRIGIPVQAGGGRPAPAVVTGEDMDSPANAGRLSSTVQVVALALPQPLAFSQRILATWRGWLLMIYLGIAAIAVARLLAGIFALRRVIRNAVVVDDDAIAAELLDVAQSLGIEECPRLVASDEAEVPVMWGVKAAVLILPSAGLEWSIERLRVVFLHELAHWRRRDVGALLLMRAATAVYWFHPVVWSLERSARRDCERACDDVVLAAGTRASDYADHLLAIARNMPSSEPFGAVTVAMSRPAELEGRLLAILHDRIRRGAISLPMYGVLTAAMLAITIPLGAAHLVPTHADVELGVKRSIEQAVAGGVKGGISGGVEGGVKGGVKDGVKYAIEEWNERGKQDFRAGRYDDAIENFSNVIRANPFYASARYNLACAYAMRGDSALALRTLREAVLHGYSDADHMRRDEDLASIRGSELDAIAELANNLVIGQWGNKDWAPVIPRYESFANAHPDIDRAWFNLGFVLLSAGEARRAIDVYQRVVRSGYRPETSMYNLACSYARAGERENALQWLRQAEDAGFNVGEFAASDPDIASLRNDPWVASLIARKKHK
jgi:beta-lactamase regulating signal transducer with metallopeptidase domain